MILKIRLVFRALGALLCLLGALMLVPALLALAYGEEDVFAHLIAAAVSGVLGGVLLIVFRRRRIKEEIGIREYFK